MHGNAKMSGHVKGFSSARAVNYRQQANSRFQTERRLDLILGNLSLIESKG
jgi:hypothetical protein